MNTADHLTLSLQIQVPWRKEQSLLRQKQLPSILTPELAWIKTSPPKQGWWGTHTLPYARRSSDGRQGKGGMFTLLQKNNNKNKNIENGGFQASTQCLSRDSTLTWHLRQGIVLLAGKVKLREWNHFYFCWEGSVCLLGKEEVGGAPC